MSAVELFVAEQYFIVLCGFFTGIGEGNLYRCERGRELAPLKGVVVSACSLLSMGYAVSTVLTSHSLVALFAIPVFFIAWHVGTSAGGKTYDSAWDSPFWRISASGLIIIPALYHLALR